MANDEINPEHAVTKTLHDQWHKVVAIMMWKLKIQSFKITPQLLGELEAAFPGDFPAVLAHEHDGVLEISLITMEEAKKLGTQ
jgi:hypothetical protein